VFRVHDLGVDLDAGDLAGAPHGDGDEAAAGLPVHIGRGDLLLGLGELGLHLLGLLEEGVHIGSGLHGGSFRRGFRSVTVPTGMAVPSAVTSVTARSDTVPGRAVCPRGPGAVAVPVRLAARSMCGGRRGPGRGQRSIGRAPRCSLSSASAMSSPVRWSRFCGPLRASSTISSSLTGGPDGSSGSAGSGSGSSGGGGASSYPPWPAPPERPSACPGVVCPRAPPWPWPASAARTRRSQPCGSACCGAPGPAGVPGPAAPRPGACAPPAAGPLPDEQVSAHSPPTTSLTDSVMAVALGGWARRLASGAESCTRWIVRPSTPATVAPASMTSTVRVRLRTASRIAGSARRMSSASSPGEEDDDGDGDDGAAAASCPSAGGDAAVAVWPGVSCQGSACGASAEDVGTGGTDVGSLAGADVGGADSGAGPGS